MKYISLIVGFLIIPSMAMAGECIGGTWITANSMDNNPNGNCTATTCNGATFCVSNGGMNWWSAFTWCASNGLHLVGFNEACPGIASSAAKNEEGSCPNMQGLGGSTVWSGLSANSSYVFTIALSLGSVRQVFSKNDVGGGIRALCK